MATGQTLILGGTSGLGYELYRQSPRDVRTLVVGRRELDLLSSGDLLLKTDLSSQDSVDALLLRLRELTTDLPITDFFWVSGVLRRVPSLQLEPADILTMVDVNLRHPLLIAAWVWRHMNETAWPCRFTVISSTVAVSPAPRDDEAVYAAVKTGQAAYTRAIGKQGASAHQQVSLFLPGGMKTEFWDENEIDDDMFASFLDPSKVAAKILTERAAQREPFLELLIPRGSL